MFFSSFVLFGATNIAFVVDGPPVDPQLAESSFISTIKSELSELISPDDFLTFVSSDKFTGDWSTESVQSHFQQAINDKSVDMIICRGVIAGRMALSYGPLPKPVFIPLLIDPSEELVSRDRRSISAHRTTGVKNLYYVDLQGTFADDLRVFSEIISFKKLVIIYGPTIKDNGSMAEDFLNVAKTFGVEVTGRQIMANGAGIDSLNLDCDAVMVLPLPQAHNKVVERLAEKINSKNLPSYAYAKMANVEAGLMASYLPELGPARLARRIALNVRKVIEGKKPESLSVHLELDRKVVLNIGTAKRIGVSPQWALMADAVLLNEDWIDERDSYLSIDTAVKEVLMANLKLLAQGKYIDSAHEELRQARSALRPKINIGVQQANFDSVRSQSSFVHQQHEVSGTANFSTLLMSEKARSGITVAQNLHRASQYELDSLRLTLALKAAVSFLSLLKYKAITKIRYEDLALTRASLKRAQVMVAAGSVRKNEEYRWLSQVASGKSALFAAKALVGEEKLFLNSLMNRDLTQPFGTESKNLENLLVAKVDKDLDTYIENPRFLKEFTNYMVDTAYEEVPLLKAIQKNIDAQRRIYMAAKRSYFVPDISLYGNLNDVWASSGNGGIGDTVIPGFSSSDLEWNGGIRLDIPLTTGGERKAQKRKSYRVLEQLEFELEQSQLDVALSVRQSIEGIRATRPTIGFANEAADAAGMNYDLVSEAYNAGAVSIIILIDAQAKKLASDQAAVSALYDHMIQVMKTQRAAGFFTFLMSDSQYKKWIDGFKLMMN